MIEATDLELLQKGDLPGLVHRHYGAVFGLVRKLLRSEADARDAAQESFARALQGLPSFDSRRPFRPWILSIAGNLVRDLLRKRRELPLTPQAEEELPDLVVPGDTLIRGEERELVLAARDRLPFDLKMVVTLHFQQDLAPAEIAQVMGITQNAVRIRLYRALAALRNNLV